MELVFATGNPNKVAEVQAILGNAFTIKSLADLGFTDELPENQETLEGNAIEKAEYVAQKFGVNCFSEDTGLEITCLDGRPGVYSARYGGDDKHSGDNMAKVLTEMKDCSNRKAQFRTVIALIMNGKVQLFEGRVEGSIIQQPTGSGGFGYDPIFQPDGYDQTFGELPAEVKLKISHRSKAMHKLIAHLEQL